MMMSEKYIVINPENLDLSVTTKLPKQSFAISTKLGLIDHNLLSLERIVHREIYRAVYARDKRLGIRACYQLAGPDPWMIARYCVKL